MLAFCAALLSTAVAARGSQSPEAHAAVIGGSPAEAGTFPSLAFVIDVKGALADQCTGTVVASNLVLTAAHCAENMQTGDLYHAADFQVVTGAVEWNAPTRQLSGVSRVIIYPKFSRRADDGDAALLVLSTPTTAPPIALATAANSGWVHAGTAGTIAGWGKTHYLQSTPTKRLQEAPTGVQTSSWCTHHAVLFDPKSEICTIDPPGYRTGGCEGDSGGPLIAVDPADGAPFEIGVTIRAQYTCATHYPTVFTRVSEIYPWVHRWIAALKPPPAPVTSTTTTTTTTATS
jgi:secreted trypsin-like serine protease